MDDSTVIVFGPYGVGKNATAKGLHIYCSRKGFTGNICCQNNDCAGDGTRALTDALSSLDDLTLLPSPPIGQVLPDRTHTSGNKSNLLSTSMGVAVDRLPLMGKG
jgi:hypothetical protein